MNIADIRLFILFFVPMPPCSSSQETETIKLSGTGLFNLKPCIDELLQNFTAWSSDQIGLSLSANYSAPPTNLGFTTNFSLLTRPDSAYSFLTLVGQTDLSVLNRHPDLVVFPIFAEPLIVVYRVVQSPGILIPSLSLSPQQYVGIFQGTIQNWNDDAMATAGMGLPDAPITVYLHKAFKSDQVFLPQQLALKYGGTGVCPPASPNNNNFRMVTTPYAALGGVAITDNSLGITGYLEYKKNVVLGDIFGAAWMSDYKGDMVDPFGAYDSPNFNESVAATIFDENYQANVVLPQGGGYPLGVFVFLAVRRRAGESSQNLDCDTQTTLLRFIRWVSVSAAGRDITSTNYLTPLPNITIKTVQEAALRQMRCGPNDSISVYDLFIEQYELEQRRVNIGLAVGLPLTLLLLIALSIRCFCLASARLLLIRRAQQQIYNVLEDRVKLIKASKEKYECMMQVRRYLEGRGSMPLFVVGEFQDDVVMLRRINIVVTHIEFTLRVRLVQLMHNIRHPNLVRFYGLTELRHFQSKCFVISQFCPLGDLRTALNNKRHELDAPIKFGMLKGITEGLHFLHLNGIVHGNLRSSGVYLEADWSTKISDWDITVIEVLADKFRNRERIWRHDLTVEEESVYLPPLLWSAPEILTAVFRDEILRPTTACDIFSHSIIFFEILTRDLPYEYNLLPHSMTYNQLFAMVRRPVNPLRPLDFKDRDQISTTIPQSVVQIMKACWVADPAKRPAIRQVREILTKVRAEMKRLADLTIVHTRSQIEQYKRNIIKNNDEIVELTKELEHTKIDFLTRWVYESHLEGETIEPKFYQVAYVLRCALVNYDGLCAPTHGDAVLYFVDRFYRIIDQVVPPDHNIHRLHSTGDEITLIGAIPTGGVEYASKMATLAFDLLVAVWHADLMDIDWDRMEVRVGMGCGPVVAGITGNIHRAFTVVGSSAEAAVVESAGAAYRILITEAFQEALKVYPDFTTEVNLDEKHTVANEKTFWLVRKDRYKFQNVLDEIAMAYPLPDELGRIVEIEDTQRRARDRRNRQVVKASIAVQYTGSYIEKDPRSGYLIEHRNRTKAEPSLLSVAQLKEGHRHRAYHQEHQTATHTQSHVFGSMLGAEAFTTLRKHYARHRHKQRLHREEQQLKDFQKLLAGQLGAIPDMAVGHIGAVARLEVYPSAVVPTETASSVLNPSAGGFDGPSAEDVASSFPLFEVVVPVGEPTAPSHASDSSEKVMLTVEQRIAMFEKSHALDQAEEDTVRRRLRKKHHRKKKENTTSPRHVREKLSSHSVMAKTSLWVSQLPDEPLGVDNTEPLLTVNDDVVIYERTRESRRRRREKRRDRSTNSPSRRNGSRDLMVDDTHEAEEYITDGVQRYLQAQPSRTLDRK